MVGCLEAQLGQTVVVLGLVETKLPADVEAPSIDGFCVVARRDRTDEGGGGVIIYVRDAFVARRIESRPTRALYSRWNGRCGRGSFTRALSERNGARCGRGCCVLITPL